MTRVFKCRDILRPYLTAINPVDKPSVPAAGCLDRRPLRLLLFAICGLIGTSPAVAQGVRGAIDVRVETADGTPPAGAMVEIVAASGSGSIAEARVAADTPTVSLPARLATTMVVRVSLSGFLAAERPVVVGPGEVVSLSARLTRTGGGETSTLVERDRYAAPRETSFDRRALESLPSASTVSSLLETSHPFVIADRIDGGGQWPGDAVRLGSQHGSAAAQTLFRLAGVDVTDPRLVGAPPSDVALPMLETVVVQSASLDPSAPGPGPVVDLVVRRPSAAWSGEARFAIAPDGFQSPAGDMTPVTRLVSGRDGDLSAGGPLGGLRLGLFVSGRAASASRIERDRPIAVEPAGGSAMAHLVFSPTADSEWRTVATFDNADRPLAARARFADRDVMQRDRSAMLHTTWEARRGGSLWTVGAAWQRATTDGGVAANARGGVVERLLDGAPLDLVAPADASRTRWDVQFGLAPATRRWLGRAHDLRLGASVGGGALSSRAGPQPAFAEVVGGRPARVWDVAVSGESSRRSVVGASAFVSDRVALSDRFTLLAALRAESDHGLADGGGGSIDWFTVTPRVALRWRAGERFSITTGYAWYGHRLPLSHLAVGDPSGPAGVMSRWDDRDQDGTFTPSELTAVAAIGSDSRIDADLRRPTTSEFRIGFEYGIRGVALGHHGARSAPAPSARARQRRRHPGRLHRALHRRPGHRRRRPIRLRAAADLTIDAPRASCATRTS